MNYYVKLLNFNYVRLPLRWKQKPRLYERRAEDYAVKTYEIPPGMSVKPQYLSVSLSVLGEQS